MKYKFEFRGGFKDGEVIVGDSGIHESDGRIQAYRHLTNDGRIGTRFMEIRPPTAEEDKVLDEMLKISEPISLTPRGPWDFFEHRPLTGQHREECERLAGRLGKVAVNHRVVYEVTLREETEDGIVIRLESIGSPETDDQGPR
ncbi:MAG: hypothetical protein ABSG53_09625 [Thermoguttaceae bacterium]|jgi:hypothetical protein